MGVVYRAHDTRLDRTVAIKIVHPDAAASRQRRERFAREARAASALNHSHIVTIHDIDRDSSGGADRDFIVMEYVDGSSLDRILEQKRSPSARRSATPSRSQAVVKPVLDWLDGYLGPVNRNRRGSTKPPTPAVCYLPPRPLEGRPT
jgi:serine/threonine protein kinase